MLYVDPMAGARFYGADGKLDESAQRKVALEELEHFFTFTLLQEMRKSIPEDGLFDGGSQRRMFEEMLDDTLSAEMARSGQIGLARQIDEQLRASELQAKLTGETRAMHGENHGLPLARPTQGISLGDVERGLPLTRGTRGLPLTTHKGLTLL